MLGAANDAAHLAAAAPAPAVDSPTTDAQPPASTNHVDIRAIEQHVATINIAAPRPAAPVSQGEEEPPSPSAARAPWLQQWRLRVALSSPHALLELFVELSLLAGRCFAGAGRGRTAAALRCDVADVLAREGRHAAAAALYEQLVSLVGCWRVLARHTLQRLLRCQQVVGHCWVVCVCCCIDDVCSPRIGTQEPCSGAHHCTAVGAGSARGCTQARTNGRHTVAAVV